MTKNKENVEAMANMSKRDKRIWIAGMIQDTQEQIDLLDKGLQAFTKANVAVPAVQDITKQEGKDGELVKVNYSTAEDRWADPRKYLPLL